MAKRTCALSTGVDPFKSSSLLEDLDVLISWFVDSADQSANFLNKFKVSNLPTQYNSFFGASANGFDCVTKFISAGIEFSKVKNAKRNKSQKKTLASMELATASSLLVGTVIANLAQFSVVKGLLSAIFTPAGAFIFAAAAWVMAVKELYNLFQVSKKLNNFVLLEDRIKKYEYISAQLKKRQQEARQLNLSTRQKARLEKKISKLTATKKVLAQQSLALFRVEREKFTTHLKGLKFSKKREKVKEFHNNCFSTAQAQSLKDDKSKLAACARQFKQYEEKLRLEFPAENLRESTRKDQLLVNYLERKQVSKAHDKAFSTIIYILSAVGLSLLAAGLFFTPLVVAGITVCAVAAGLKLGEFITTKIFEHIAKKHLMKKTRNHVVWTLSKDSDEVDPNNKVEQKKGSAQHYYIAWLVFKLKNAKDENLPERDQYYDELNNASSKKRKKILRRAVRYYVKKQIINQTLGFTDDETGVLECLSNKDKKTIIQRESNRHAWKSIKRHFLFAPRQSSGMDNNYTIISKASSLSM